MIHAQLFKLDSTGKTRVWKIESDRDLFRTISGVQGGKMVTSAWTTCLPKNVGRSNETTGSEQCQLEVAAKYKKKLAQGGYHTSVETIGDGSSYTEPMLSVTHTGERTLDYPVWVQPKLDGIRCIAKWCKESKAVKLWTRRGKPIVSIPHIAEALTSVLKANKDFILDGELYNHDLKNDFQQITSAVRKQTVTTADLKLTRQIQYHVYDVVDAAPFYMRTTMVSDVVTEVAAECIQDVATYQALNIKAIERLNEDLVGDGYEGIMIRSKGAAPYQEGKRSTDLLKYKSFDTDEFTILDILPGIGNRAGMAGKIVYTTADGKVFESGIRGNFDYFRKLLDNKVDYIGREATVRYFGLTDAGSGKPRFAVTIDIHENKRED